MGSVIKLSKKINNSYIELKKSVEDRLAMVDEKIEKKLESNVDLVKKMSSYHLETGGKKLRALITLGASKLCGYTKGTRDVNFAACVELIHSATLIYIFAVSLQGRHTSSPFRSRAVGSGHLFTAPQNSTLGSGSWKKSFRTFPRTFWNLPEASLNLLEASVKLP